MAIENDVLRLIPVPESDTAERDIDRSETSNRPLATAAKPVDEKDVWHQDNPDLVCPRQSAIAIYENTHGQAVIRQEQDWNDEGDTYVVISKHYLQDVIDRLQRILSED